MSIEYWPILGYGVCVSEDIIDYEKVFQLMQEHNYQEMDAETPGELIIEDILQFLCDIAPIPLHWSTTGDCDCNNAAYLYIPAVLPWDDYPKITKQEADKILVDLVNNIILIENYEILPQEIADVGCG